MIRLATNIRGFVAIAILTGTAFLALPAFASAGVTYHVNTLADTNAFAGIGCEGIAPETECSLREAIEVANAHENGESGADEIEFEGLPSGGTIELVDEPLPRITNPVRIDATTVPGYAGTPLLALDGSDAESELATAGVAFGPGGGGSRLDGIAIGGFDIGVELGGSQGNYLCENYVGVAPDGVTPFPNVTGVETAVGAPGNRIGAECPGNGNLISGNASYGIVDFGQETVISDNEIGLDVTGGPLPNGSFGAGILVTRFAEDPYIGGEVESEGSRPNVIAFNNGPGILVEEAAVGSAIRRNSIYDNLGTGIQYNGGNPESAPPTISVIEASPGSTELFGSIAGRPEETYYLDFFANEECDSSGSGEGRYYLGSEFVETDSAGGATFVASDLEPLPPEAGVITATATPEEPPSSTTEFGLCASNPPTTTIEPPTPDSPSPSSSATFTFSGEDPEVGLAGFQCKLDAGSFESCASPESYVGLADGPHTFEVRAVNKGGNFDPSPASFAWTVEATPPSPPELTSTMPSSPANDTTPTLLGNAGGASISVYQSEVCGGAPIATVTPAELAAGVTVTANANAITEFSATATSASALTSACSAPFTYREDSIAPTVQIDAQPPNPSSSASASFTFSGSDPGGSGIAGFECSLDGAAFTACASPRPYADLADGSHGFQVRATDNAGNVSTAPAAYSWTINTLAPAQESTVNPVATTAAVNGETVDVAPEEGKVYVKRPGQNEPTLLKEGETIPVGSIVDATRGKVLLTSVNAAGEAQSALFYGGKFLVAQHEGSGLVILKLRGGNLGSCEATGSSSGATTSGSKGRKLWGSGHGNFRTEGNYGSATVRGTIWFTEDRCGSTFFKVKRGVVSVRDFGKGKTVALPAGKTYLAKP